MNPPSEAFSDDYDVEKNSGEFSIDDDDECEIEDIDEDSDEETLDHITTMSKLFRDDPDDDSNYHDQLPSVEEVKASSAYLPTARIIAQTNRRKLYLVIAGAALAAMVLSVSITVGVFKRSNKKVDPVEAIMLTGRYEEVAQYIFESGVSDLPSLRMSGTAESYACAFMANGDAYNDVITMIDEDGRRKFMERYVLALMYYKSRGTGWKDQYSFLHPIDHCQWHLQYSTPQGRFLKGVQCNKDGFVVDLDLSKNNLVLTTIPYELDYFEHLERLHIYGNNISGYLPERLKNLKKLKSLGLMDLKLNGDIPSWIGHMRALTTLALSNVKMRATIPDSFENLGNLRVLGLDGMGLEGSIAPLANLRKLEALYLEDNFLTYLPQNVNWPSMIELDMSNNMIQGPITDTLFELPNLLVLDLNKNYFTGDFPHKFIENDSIQYLSIHDNGFTGTIPDRIGFLKKLKHFDVSSNLLTGTIPDTIQLLTDLVSLTASSNNFSRQRLDGTYFDVLTNLHDLALKDCSLTGSIPESLSYLTSLRMLDLDRNELVGSIPTLFGRLKHLAILQLNRNMLTGKIPNQLSHLEKLQILLLDGNNLHGHTDELCSVDGPTMQHFTSDCYPSLNNEAGPEVECRCCTLCCNDENPDCNDHDWTSSHDLKAKYGYIRQSYEFDLDENKIKEDWREAVREEAQGPPAAASSPGN